MILRANANPTKSSIPLMILVIILLAGQLIYIGFASLYHFVVIWLSCVILLKKRFIRFGGMTPTMSFFVLWCSEALLSVLWAPDKLLALQYTYYILLVLAVCGIFHNYINRQNIDKYVTFMIWVLFICNIISIWEVLTGNHIIKDYLSTPQRQRLLQYVPGTFYRNPNDFATLIIQMIPFSLSSAISCKGFVRILAIFNIAASFFSVLAAQSRTQIILLVAIYICSILFIKKKKLLGILAFVTVSIAIIYSLYPPFSQLVKTGLTSIEYGEILSSTEEGASLGIRISLLKNAGLILLDTLGFGIGAGCHRVVMSEYSANYYSTNGVLVMHNLLGEIFVDYGIIIGIAFLFMIVLSTIYLIKIYRFVEDPKTKQLSFFLSLSLGMFVICGISSSSILQLTSLWITICFISSFIKVYTNDSVLTGI